MASYGVVESPDLVDYSTKCCCLTIDNIYYEVPKEYFRLNATLARRKLLSYEPFSVPLDSVTFEPFLALLEKVSILSTAAVDGETRRSDEERPEWMRHLNKRQMKFVSMCLGITSWDGKDVQFYEEPLPKIHDVVWVKVTQVNDTSASVQLMEYGKREGIIPFTELTRGRVRSMGKFIRIGRSEALQVIRMDKEKGYIDLSRKQVTPKEAKACEANFHKGSDVRSIVCRVADECDINPLKAMEMIAFPLYRREPGKHAWDWLHELNKTQDTERILGPLNLAPEVVERLMSALRNAMRTMVVTLHAEVEITCFTCDGVEAIRKVLMLGRTFGEKEEPVIPITVNIIGPPKYGLRARTDMRDEGLERMKAAIDAMKEEIVKNHGQLTVITPPEVHGEDELDKHRRGNGNLDDDNNNADDDDMDD